MKKYTIGGFPETEAYSFENTDNFRAFGRIIYYLTSMKVSDQRFGYLAYFEFRNHFMKQSWDEMISNLNDRRAQQGFPSIDSLVHEIRENLIITGRKNTDPISKQPSPALLILSSHQIAPASETVTQLCLAI
jgi:hypothetical protein